jgi:hypothetical protein
MVCAIAPPDLFHRLCQGQSGDDQDGVTLQRHPPSFVGRIFKVTTGVDMPHLPYPGDVPALNDLVAGKVQLQFSGLGATIE